MEMKKIIKMIPEENGGYRARIRLEEKIKKLEKTIKDMKGILRGNDKDHVKVAVIEHIVNDLDI